MPTQSDLVTEIKAKMIREASELFHEKGVKVTTPEDVVKASGGTMNQFYRYFHNKEGLIHEVILSEFEAFKSGRTPLVCKFASWRDLEKWFLTHVELQRSFDMSRTCLFGKIGNEVTEHDAQIREDVSAIFEFMKGKIVDFLKKEKVEGRLAKDANESSLADFCIATVQGAMLLGKVKKDSQPVEAAVREALAHLRTYVV
jgi:TetR/AcrR family transcriptional regulator, transcriptional repressor for nem operon